MDESSEHLSGGNTDPVLRIGDTVRRVPHPWSPRIHDLLTWLHDNGFESAPRALGTDERGRDIYSYIPGHVGHYPWTPPVAGTAALTSAARLLRRFHDATAPIADRWRDGWQWEPEHPVEVVCHNRVAPRLIELTRFLRAAADRGDTTFARHIAEGHLDRYLRDIAYIRVRTDRWIEQATSD